mmetsp:Transcript_39224/g.101481  ORF Transcript_39224/g.101481 Transcript_39224/m.101481 type:complete len:359 (-) Transcript_39224:45-1121(-)
MPRQQEGPTDEDWFDSYVKPDASVSSYTAAPPRGMTNPPQNPLVRAQLARDLKEYGTALQAPEWPPPRRMSSSQSEGAFRSTRSSPATSRRMGSTQASLMSNMGATSSSGFGDKPKRKPQPTWSKVSEDVAKDPVVDFAAQSKGSPTVMWHTPAVVAENRRRQEELAELKRIRAQGPFKKKLADRMLSDNEFRSAAELLKGKSGLHTAFVADRFRFSADMSKGAPMVMGGPSLMSGTLTSAWTSDASALVNFHNGAMRMANPPALQALPKEAPPKKKSKKNKEQDDDHLELSASGMFKPRYPIDNSLKSLRRLKKSMFPDVVKIEEEEQEKKDTGADVREAEQAKLRELAADTMFAVR